MNGDPVGGLLEEDAVVADAEAQQPFEFAAERLDSTDASGRVLVNCSQNVERGALLDGSDFIWNVRVEADFLHWDDHSPWWRRT